MTYRDILVGSQEATPGSEDLERQNRRCSSNCSSASAVDVKQAAADNESSTEDNHCSIANERLRWSDSEEAVADHGDIPETDEEWPLTPRLLRQDSRRSSGAEPMPGPKVADMAGFMQMQQPPLVLSTSPQYKLPDLPSPQYKPMTSCFRVAYLGGVEVRAAPSNQAPLTGAVLQHNEVVEVSEELPTTSGLVHLRLADGRGWVFDDSAVLPDDPSMVRQSPLANPFVGPQSTPHHRNYLQPMEAQDSSISWFRVAYVGGISLRSQPSFDAPHTGVALQQDQVVSVVEELSGSDGRVYLRLCDGSGWAFDDAALFPEDPSVKRVSWRQLKDNVWSLEDCPLDLSKRNRRQTGGKRHTRRGRRIRNAPQASPVHGVP
eukprot:TRINITY_DN78378_c0_g1_i1.p1 TRINITY_DN78378_c0_g1~~TRINITY_DN78378_c0_g1_i1.p1  ORF type:complete len:376 (-),score=58.77 TRINITY_DN78378_c0_g1_i1:116-1243(-)